MLILRFLLRKCVDPSTSSHKFLRICSTSLRMTSVPEIGEVYEGKISSIMPYGAFVEFMPGKDGLLHISEIDWKRLESVEQAGLKEGDSVTIKLMDIDPKTGKFKLSRKVLLPKPEGYEERPQRAERGPRPERGPRQDRGPRREH